MKKQNLAKQYRLAGIKGMSESKGSKPVIKKVAYKSEYNILPRLENETFEQWKNRCKK